MPDERVAFAHEALVEMADGADVRALGAAITVGVCGHLDHEPPCLLAPHCTSSERSDDLVRVRVLFAADPEQEDAVRAEIDAALTVGNLELPDTGTVRWHLRSSGASALLADERDHAARLAAP